MSSPSHPRPPRRADSVRAVLRRGAVPQPVGAPDQVGISGRAELIQSIPYLLGFAPSRSLVLVGTQRGVLLITARADLEVLLPASGGAAPPGDALAATIGTVTRAGADALTAVVFGAAAPGGLDLGWTQVTADLMHLAATAGCTVTDVLWTAGGRWGSLLGPADSGTPMPSSPGPYVTAAVLQGRAPVQSRDELRTRFEPADPGECAAVLGELARAEASGPDELPSGREIVAAARRSCRPMVGAPSPSESAGYGTALGLRSRFEVVWSTADSARLDGRPLWLHLARTLPPRFTPPALFLYAWSAWRCGDGALAAIALERLFAARPRHVPGRQLQTALDHGINPHTFPRLVPTSE